MTDRLLQMGGSDAKGTPRLRLRITAAAERILRSGHPWLFAESILEENRTGQLGELAIIYDKNDRLLALGLFDPLSPIRVRVLQTGRAQQVDSEWWRGRLDRALERRQGLFDEYTTGYRCIHGESDGWPGLVLDRYGSTLVIKLYTAAWLPRLAEMVHLITQRLRPENLVLRLSRNIQPIAGSQFGRSDGEMLCGAAPMGLVQFRETGLQFEADVLQGQKTGFFLDQRENRRRVEALSAGRKLLNVFCFSGAFSVYSARGGAESAADLDISAHALAGARRNFALNRSTRSVASCRHELVQADAFEWLARNPKPSFDLIVLDPPSLARRQADKAGALGAYSSLAESAVRHLRPSGILVACSCSAHVTSTEFFETVRQAASRTRLAFQELRTTGHPPDHPATFKEGEYLKAIYLRKNVKRET